MEYSVKKVTLNSLTNDLNTFTINCNGQKIIIPLSSLRDHIKTYEFIENNLFVKRFKNQNFLDNFEIRLDMFDYNSLKLFVNHCILKSSLVGVSYSNSLEMINLHRLSLYLNQPYILGFEQSILPIIIDFNVGLVRDIKRSNDDNNISIYFPTMNQFRIPNITNLDSLLCIGYYNDLFLNFIKALFPNDNYGNIKISSKPEWGTDFTHITVKRSYNKLLSKKDYEIILEKRSRY